MEYIEVYLEYEKAQTQLIESLRKYNNLLNEKETMLLQNTPKGNIDERIEDLKLIVNERTDKANELENKLMKSEMLEDQVYVCIKLKGMKVSQVSEKLYYSVPQIYRIVEKIDQKLQRSSF